MSISAGSCEETGNHINNFDAQHVITLKSPRISSAKVVDSDNPPWSEEMLGPPVIRRGRGPQKAPTKVLTTIRLDAAVLAFFRSQGCGTRPASMRPSAAQKSAAKERVLEDARHDKFCHLLMASGEESR